MDTITIQGNYFYKGTERWAPKGLCYQPTDNVDPISDNNLATIQALCKVDTQNPENSGDFIKLGINAIRVYQIDPSSSHDQVMKELENAGIYVMIGCVDSDVALPRDGSYPCSVASRCQEVVKTFSVYPNTLAFSVSNELLDAAGQETSAAAAKALARDTKSYLASLVSSDPTTYRQVPVGLAMRDVRSYTWPAAKYYACGPEADRVDFIAYNIYVWCAPQGATNFSGQIDAYYKLYDFFKNFPIPVFWGENGCMNQGIREWKQVPYLYGNKEIYAAPSPNTKYNMADVIQGGFAFRYVMRNENKGLVYSDGSQTPDGGFDQLTTEYATVTSFGGTTPGAGNSGDAQDCSTFADPTFKPTMPTQCGGTPPTSGTMVYLTNEVSPATQIQFLVQQTSTGTKWNNIATLNAGAPKTAAYIPTDATGLMMIYNPSGSDWPMGCQITDISTIKENDTIEGKWVAPNGTGACTIVPPKST